VLGRQEGLELGDLARNFVKKNSPNTEKINSLPECLPIRKEGRRIQEKGSRRLGKGTPCQGGGEKASLSYDQVKIFYLRGICCIYKYGKGTLEKRRKARRRGFPRLFSLRFLLSWREKERICRGDLRQEKKSFKRRGGKSLLPPKAGKGFLSFEEDSVRELTIIKGI